MKLKQISKILEAEAISGFDGERDIKMGCGCDLMSDVLTFTKPGSVLLTGLTNIQVVYTASTAGIKAICFVRGKRPFEETIELANRKEIALLSTKLPLFEACGRLYKKGLAGGSELDAARVK
jgi:predicted transcriptional regulator